MWLILMKYDAIQIKAYFIKHEVLKKIVYNNKNTLNTRDWGNSLGVIKTP